MVNSAVERATSDLLVGPDRFRNFEFCDMLNHDPGLVHFVLIDEYGRTTKMSQAEKVVCVTGASGFIASWLVKLLLQHGYTVNATVRDPNDPRKTEHLLALDGANERLHLFKAELQDEGSFDSSVQGCIGVFHTATPVLFASTVKDPKAEIVEPAVKGTLNVLRSCAKVPSIKRVIITSSLSTVVLSGKPLADDVVVDETWFSDPVLLEKSKQWYMLSKTLAEKAAWKFSEENGLNMISINPGMVSGPPLQPTLNSSLLPIAKLIGAKTFLNGIFRWVDVRDVANVHIRAFESSSASGRYPVTGKNVHSSEVLKILRKLYPDLNFPERCSEEKRFTSAFPAFQVSREKVKSLGINFTPLEVSLKDTVDSLKEKNLLSKL